MSGPDADRDSTRRATDGDSADTVESADAAEERAPADTADRDGARNAANSTDDPRAASDAGPPDGTAPAYGDRWVYERIVGALPGAALSPPAAIALQVGVFGSGLLVVAAAYDLWAAVPAGAAAVAVAAAGSALVVRLGATNRALDVPRSYYRLLFGSGVEVVLTVLAFSAVVTHLFVFDPATVGEPSPLSGLLPFGVVPAEEPLLTALFGADPPTPAVYLALLVLWDLCYRIGTSWWAAVVSLYRALRLDVSPADARTFRRLDGLNVGFAALQLLLVPFVLDRPVLLVALVGHVLAVAVVSGAAAVLSLAGGE